MANNPYAPPSAPVADIEENRLPDNSNPLFAVGTTKVLVMSLVTLGFYQIYWFYRHWSLVRGRDRSDIMPVMRAIFAIFFVYQLFKRMREDGATYGVSESLAAGPLATAFILLQFTSRAPDPWWLIYLASCVVVTLAQQYANKVNLAAAPEHERNERFSGLNWAGIVLGGLLLFLVVVGLFFAPVE
jgi:hypothetical protein